MVWLLVTCEALPLQTNKYPPLCTFTPQLDKARTAYHKVSRKEHIAREREAHAQGNPDVAIDKQKKIQEEREVAQQEAEKVRHSLSLSFIWVWFVFSSWSWNFVSDSRDPMELLTTTMKNKTVNEHTWLQVSKHYENWCHKLLSCTWIRCCGGKWVWVEYLISNQREWSEGNKGLHTSKLKIYEQNMRSFISFLVSLL